MKIASWNVNGVRSCFQKGELEAFVEEASPDVLCLQETKTHPDQLNSPPDSRIKSLGGYPFQTWSSCGVKKGYSGTVTFSRSPASEFAGGQMGIKKFDYEGRIAASDHGPFILLNIYFPNGAMTQERHLFKQEFLRRLPPFLQKIRRQTKKELVVAGDYNAAYLDIDVFSPETLGKTSGFLPEERLWMRRFLQDGWTDVFRYFFPEKEEAFTWWSHREGARRRNRGWRIDHIFVTEGLKPLLKGVKIFSGQHGSDHCPIMMELKEPADSEAGGAKDG